MVDISLPDFLKNYTAISEHFIDEYYKFYEITQVNQFGIPIEMVTSFLNITKIKTFTERIREKYILNADYVIVRKISKSVKDVQQSFYFLTFDCFEKICMMSHAQKANEVRDYFIILRKFVDYYKNHFAKNINNLIAKYTGVYILLVNKDKNIFKIGKTNAQFRERFKSYAIGKDKHPDIKFIMHTDNPDIVEECTKLFTKVNQIRGKSELRKIDGNILKRTMFDCALLDGILHERSSNKKSSGINKLDINKHDAYIIFNEGDEIEYINTKGNRIGYTKITYN
jgi:phage anti-repressor protein